MPLFNLETIVVYVSSVSASAQFYEDLGFKVTRTHSDHASVDLGNTSLQLHQEDSETILEFVEAAAVRPRGASLYLYFSVSDIRDWYAKFGHVSQYEGPRLRPWGKQEVLVQDPDGFQLVFYS